jgi:Ca-activated chloride channel family protein
MYSFPFVGTYTFEYPFVFLFFILYLICKKYCSSQEGLFFYPHLSFYEKFSTKLHLSRFIEPIALLFLFIGLASPVVIDKYDPKNRIGYDIVLTIDASRSMSTFGFDTQEKNATRLDCVKKIAHLFSLERENDNIGLVVFGDYSYIASPVTYEKDIIKEMIDEISIAIAGDNTAIGDGIAMGVKLLDRSHAKTKIIILLTDGISNAGIISPHDSANLAAQRNIRLYTIGIGNKGEFDKAMLASLALKGGGKSFEAYNSNELQHVYDEISSLEKSPIKAKDFPRKTSLFTYPLAIGIFLFFLSLYYRQKGVNV